MIDVAGNITRLAVLGKGSKTPWVRAASGAVQPGRIATPERARTLQEEKKGE